MHTVDVVVVSYNSAKGLRTNVKPLASVADFRLIVVDSASTDHSLETLSGLPVEAVPLTENRDSVMLAMLVGSLAALLSSCS